MRIEVKAAVGKLISMAKKLKGYEELSLILTLSAVYEYKCDMADMMVKQKKPTELLEHIGPYCVGAKHGVPDNVTAAAILQAGLDKRAVQDVTVIGWPPDFGLVIAPGCASIKIGTDGEAEALYLDHVKVLHTFAGGMDADVKAFVRRVAESN